MIKAMGYCHPWLIDGSGEVAACCVEYYIILRNLVLDRYQLHILVNEYLG